MSFFWADWQIEILRESWGKGKSAREIGEIVGKPKNAVIGRAHRDGLRGPPAATTREGRKKKERPRLTRPPLGALERSQGCQWLDGEPRERQFCGQPARDGSSFCEEHHSVCWVKHENYRSEAA